MINNIVGDITKLHVDVVVNSANTALIAGSGVSGAIHDAAGSKLAAECLELNGCQPGEAKITAGFNLPAKHIIHTVGPIYGQHHGNEPEILYSCYYESMRLAESHQARSIAFPAISTGIYSYPKDEAKEIALRALTDYYEDQPDSSIAEVYLVEYAKSKTGGFMMDCTPDYTRYTEPKKEHP